jgi:predicted lipase
MKTDTTLNKISFMVCCAIGISLGLIAAVDALI